MPYSIHKKGGGTYSVTGPSGTHAKGTTKAKAEAQVRLLRGIEHGMKPRKKAFPLTKDHAPECPGDPQFRVHKVPL